MNDEPDVIQPIPVIDVSLRTPQRPEHSSWNTYTLAGTEAPLQILPRDEYRHTAQIAVIDSADSTGAVRLGTMGQVMNGQGALLVPGMIIPIESQPMIWCVPTGDPVIISVLDQRYEG